MRRKFIIGNWKMNMLPDEAMLFVSSIKDRIDKEDRDVALCVPFVDLIGVYKTLKDTNIYLGAENFYFEDKGAFTGEISADMLLKVGVKYVIVGHSERRNIFKEDNQMINKKVLKAIEKKLVPIICCGESGEQRLNNETFDFIKSQIISAYENVKKEDVLKTLIAYEPIWAIGTGKTATSDDAEEVCKFIRNIIKDLYGDDIAKNLIILYGGSVNNKNAKELFSKEDIDGGLVGGASLKEEFVDIVNYDA